MFEMPPRVLSRCHTRLIMVIGQYDIEIRLRTPRSADICLDGRPRHRGVGDFNSHFGLLRRFFNSSNQSVPVAPIHPARSVDNGFRSVGAVLAESAGVGFLPRCHLG